MTRVTESEQDKVVQVPAPSTWQRDLIKGFLFALLILISLLFYTGNASHFIYVDF